MCFSLFFGGERPQPTNRKSQPKRGGELQPAPVHSRFTAQAQRGTCLDPTSQKEDQTAKPPVIVAGWGWKGQDTVDGNQKSQTPNHRLDGV